MQSTKSALKAAKTALDNHEYPLAVKECEKILASESTNYHANVFLGLALEKQGQDEAAESAYVNATKVKDSEILAWQGLISLFEKQKGIRLDQHHAAALRLAELYMIHDERDKCLSVVNKYTEDAKKYGTKSQYRRSLEILLPDSPIYDFLEGLIFHPSFTFMRIIEIVEAEEKEQINSEIGQRRTRLGARINQVTQEVKREVLQTSQLESLYRQVIDWTQDDELRRQYEEKLLRHAGETLSVLPLAQKATKREDVIHMASGLVIIGHPFLLAWNIIMEWDNPKQLDDLNKDRLLQYVELFPGQGLSKVVRGWLTSEISPFRVPSEQAGEVAKDADARLEAEFTSEDRLFLMTEGLEDASKSILACRIMSQYYNYLEEYETALNTAREGIKRASDESQLIGLPFDDTQNALNIALATALIYHQAPRHHAESRSLFQSILDHDPVNSSALIGIGLVYQEDEAYVEALAAFQKALQMTHDPKVKIEAAWCKALSGDFDTALIELEMVLTDIRQSNEKASMKAITLYRIGMCLWSIDPTKSARKDRKGSYARFLASLQADMNYAPTYTILGIYYADYAKDRKRARKCFQKAFELSSNEVDAAFRLATSFSSSNDWGLVEAVAQRVVESGKTRPSPGSKRKAISWPYAALGAVQLIQREYAKSIVSYQAALRIAPTDYHCWIGLGESYHNSGRYMAATRAFDHAQGMDHYLTHRDAGWFCDYMLANVKRELGEYDSAILGYQQVLKCHDKEFGVALALMQSLVDSAWHNIELGFLGQACARAIEALQMGKLVSGMRDDTPNLWKAAGDACSVLSAIPERASSIPFEVIKELLTRGADEQTFEAVADLDGVSLGTLQKCRPNEKGSTDLPYHGLAALLAYKRAIKVCSGEVHAQAVAWYNLGWSEYQAHRVYVSMENDKLSGETSGYLKGAVHCFKQAIELESGNAEFWNSLGIATSDLSPRVAQHSFVRSLYLSDKSARVWTNLGTFYLLQGDASIAQEAYTRAQSADPDFAQAWLGQALLAQESGDTREARQLFTHSFELADASQVIIKERYAMAMFDQSIAGLDISTEDLLPASLAAHQLQIQSQSSITSQHLSATISERIGNRDDAVASLAAICTALESEYEETESERSLKHFAQVKSDLARSLLALYQYDDAIENAELVLDLLADVGTMESNVVKSRLSAHMTAGLAFYYTHQMERALEMFGAALEESDDNPDVICLLARVLWAKGGRAERDLARDKLLDCIEHCPNHVEVTTLLGCIALLDDDPDTLKAVISDLEDIRTFGEHNVGDQEKISNLLNAIAATRSSNHAHQEEFDNARLSTMLKPALSNGWLQMAELSGQTYPAENAILNASKAVPPYGSSDAEELSLILRGTGTAADAQRAIMVAPHRPDSWMAFEAA